MAQKEKEREEKYGIVPGGGSKGVKGSPRELITITLVNPNWKDKIRKHFVDGYLARKQTTRKDVFRPNVLTFIEKPEPEEEKAEEEEEPEPTIEEELAEEEEKGLLQQHTLKEYKLLLIMSGTALPKAVIEDPKGNAFVVQRETRIGNKGGIVEAITQYSVFVRERDSEKPSILTIQPEYVGVQTTVGFVGQVEGTEEALEPPRPVRTPFEEKLTVTPGEDGR